MNPSTKSNPLQYVIVGLGGFGKYWCQDFLPRLTTLGKAQAVAAVDLDAKTFERVRPLGLDPARDCYTDLAAAIEDQAHVDFIVNVTPPMVHEEVVDMAIAHGLDILTEKPIAHTMQSACHIYRRVTTAGRKLAVTMSHRFDQDKQSLQHALESGEYGPLNYLSGRFAVNCRNHGEFGAFRHDMKDPLLIDGAVHQLDIFRALSGSNGKTVHAVSWNPPWGEFAGDSVAFITLEMENGVRCLWEGSIANASAINAWCEDYIRAECRDATLELDRRWLRALRSRLHHRPLATDLPLLEQEVWTNQWLAEMFCDWLLGDRDDHPADLEDNLQNAALLFAAVESAHTGKTVDVQSFLRKHLEESGK